MSVLITLTLLVAVVYAILRRPKTDLLRVRPPANHQPYSTPESRELTDPERLCKN